MSGAGFLIHQMRGFTEGSILLPDTKPAWRIHGFRIQIFIDSIPILVRIERIMITMLTFPRIPLNSTDT